MLSRLMTRKEQWVLVGLSTALCLGAGALYMHHRRTGPALDEQQGAVTMPAPEPSEASPAEAPAADAPHPPCPPVPSEAPSPPALAPPPVVVSVRGAVRHPGVYEFDGDRRVQDAIDRAGGPLDTADLSDVNLAALLLDSSTLTIPAAPQRTVNGVLSVRRGVPDAPPNPPQYTISGWRPPVTRAGAPGVSAPTPASGAEASGLIDLNSAGAKQLESLPGIGPVLANNIIEYREQHPFQSTADVQEVSGIGPKRFEAIADLVCVKPPAP